MVTGRYPAAPGITLRKVKPADLAHLRMPGAPTLSPDGRIAVVAVTRPDLAADDYSSQLWLIPTDGGEPPRRLTEGSRDSSPRISPDGQWVAFTRVTRASGSRAGGAAADHDDKPQLCVLPLAGGEARRLTDQALGVGTPAWSPDSTRLAYAARVPEAGRYGTGKNGLGDKISAGGEPPRRITKLNYRRDGLGFFLDQPAQLFVTDLDGGTSQLTEDEFGYGDPAFSPDGAWLTFASARHETANDDLARDIWIMPAGGGDPRVLTDTTLDAIAPVFTPDGQNIVFAGCWAGEERRNPVVRGEVAYLVPVAGGEVRRLLDPEHYQVADAGDLVPTADGLLVATEHRGAVHLVRVPYDGGPVEVVAGGERTLTGFAVAGDTVVTTVASTGDWGEVYVGDRRLTDFSAGYRTSATVLAQEELNGTAPDGYPVHGWIVRPSGDGPHPVLLMIHGGPFAQYGWRLFDEAQVYAEAGYAVVYGNPRGSSGYGESHGRAIIGNVGQASSIDVLALLDTALKAPDLDGDRVGVLGGSHGGYMTTWLSAHHGSRFKAAVSERAVNAVDSFVGSSDIGSFFADGLWGPQDSPLDYAGQIELPMLIIHSEQDWRCPMEQAQRLFVALRRRGVPAEMLLFPGEGHEMSRAGLPSHRIARFEAIVEWFRKYV